MLKAIKFFLGRLMIFLIYRLIRGYSWTFRLTLENERSWRDYLEQGGRVIVSVWHQQFFAVIRPFKAYGSYRPALMISKSRDGDIIAGVAARTGWFPVRGSSSQGGSEALAQMIARLRETGLTGHIVDGPRGPCGKVKPGLIRMAQAADAAIVPVRVSAEKAWHLNSWDRFLIPKPFTRVTIGFHDMIKPKPMETAEEFEEQRTRVEQIMLTWLVRVPGQEVVLPDEVGVRTRG